MPSQFTIYTSNDVGGPGFVTGTTGSLINILDYCLVYGYGTGSYYKAPAGWTKPFENSGSAYGCWRQGGGSSMSLFMNDNGPTVANAKEAWVTGWHTISSIFPAVTGSLNVGAGWGQFPLPTQQNTYGYGIVRKSSALDTTGRNWIIAADATTMYMWIWAETADLNRTYHWMFGDIYSLKGSSDLWRCSLAARVVNNTEVGQSLNNGTAYDYTDLVATPPWAGVVGVTITLGQPGCYLARNGSGLGPPLSYTKRAEAFYAGAETAFYNPSPAGTPMYGYMPNVNSPNNVGYLSPIEVIEPASTIVQRGRLRGLYAPSFYYTNYTTGQILSGSGDYAGKAFVVIRYSYCGSVWLVEISPTVETN